MLPKNFKPKNEYNLIRLGRNNDGGYLVEKNSFNEAKSLISFGLSYDWTFEKHFSRIKDCPVHCYDPTIKYSSIKKFSRKNILNLFKIKNLFNKDSIRRTINNIFLYSDYKKFFSKEIIHYESSVGIGRNKINFSEIVNRIKSYPIFLKIDIEGSEIEVINNMLDDNIFPTYLCIEFDLFLKRKDPHNLTKTCIERILQNGYTLVHNENMNITFKRG